MLDFIFDLHNHHKAAAAQATASAAKHQSSGNEQKVKELELKLERTLMVTEALWEIIKKSHKLEDSDLKSLIQEIDLRDGKSDGKVQKTEPSKCPSCGKTIQRNNSNCMYCGAESPASPFKR
jgi:hypothetical protein